MCESVAKARVESLSHREYSQTEDAMDQKEKGWTIGLGRMTGNLIREASRDPTPGGLAQVVFFVASHAVVLSSFL